MNMIAIKFIVIFTVSGGPNLYPEVAFSWDFPFHGKNPNPIGKNLMGFLKNSGKKYRKNAMGLKIPGFPGNPKNRKKSSKKKS